MKLQVEINGSDRVEVAQSDQTLTIDGEEVKYDVVKISENEHLIYIGSKIFPVKVIERKGKEMVVSIHGQKIDLTIKDHIDQILEKLGMDVLEDDEVKEVTAPMPGAIIDVMVRKGDEVEEGTTLLILEAMKMENVIKSPGPATVSKVHVEKGENVEKNHILISF